jgi:hypothetical protein
MSILQETTTIKSIIPSIINLELDKKKIYSPKNLAIVPPFGRRREHIVPPSDELGTVAQFKYLKK